ncbi:MAG TPA: HAD-IA family hydrolase [Actinomycetota bacterium]|jgi:putative hydrolase of the HAD superfamily|nr:HAD-IA family hydrolase [Actinomycetota bacterium]
MTYDAILFDLFGTLVPEFGRSDFYDTVRRMAESLGAPSERFREEWDASALERQTGVFADIEQNLRAICSILRVSVDEGSLSRAIAIRASLYDRWFFPRPGAVETLRELRARGYRLALISMCAPDAPALWRACELAPFVDAEVFSSETGLRKPDPTIYRHACDLLQVEPLRCSYVGDGAYGELTGAAALGMNAYLIRDPNVDAAQQLTPERDDGWTGAEIADLRDLLDLLPAAGSTI